MIPPAPATKGIGIVGNEQPVVGMVHRFLCLFRLSLYMDIHRYGFMVLVFCVIEWFISVSVSISSPPWKQSQQRSPNDCLSRYKAVEENGVPFLVRLYKLRLNDLVMGRHRSNDIKK